MPRFSDLEGFYIVYSHICMGFRRKSRNKSSVTAMKGLGGVGGQTIRAFVALFDCFSLFYATDLTTGNLLCTSKEACLGVFTATKTIEKGAGMAM